MIRMKAYCYFTYLIFLLAVSLFTVMPGYGQISRPGTPFPLHYPGSPPLMIYDLPVSAVQRSMAAGTDGSSMLKPAVSGILLDTDFSPEEQGTWDTVSGGLKIWRAAFHVQDAALMSLVFAPYRLQKGVKVFLYDGRQQTVLGAFTDLNNKSINILATAYIPGDLLVVEIQVPGYLETYGTLKIDGVGCDFSRMKGTGSLKDGWFGWSDTCNVDINCLGDSVYQVAKNAVVRIVFDGGERCTGFLVNNTLKTGTNYLITAEHCISSEASANAALFYFDYESPWCGGPDGSNFKSVSGATLRATGNNLDFSLLELLEPVPFTYHPYYAGWDVSGHTPASGFTIHHPLGDVKKISRENHSLTITSYGSGYADQTHWLARHWESGTTEAGSSGAPFFDQNLRVVGTLTGGQANCFSSVNDYFQMISHSWDDYANAERQLAWWLDPVKKQLSVLDGFDPYRDFWATGDTLTNIRSEETLAVETGDLAWGSYSGHNSDHLKAFAEEFREPVSKKILGLILQVADNAVASLSADLVLKIWEGDDIPGRLIYRKTLPLADLAEEVPNFVEFDSIVAAGKDFFAGYEVQYNSPQDTFSTYMAANRPTGAVNTAFVNDGTLWYPLDAYTGESLHTSFAIMPVVFDSIPETDHTPDFTSDIIAYPNPANTQIWLEFHDLSASPAEVSVFNTQGQLMLERQFGTYQRLILLDQLYFNPGIYIIRVRQGETIHNLKITIMK
jgi:lysyl endopeptidase